MEPAFAEAARLLAPHVRLLKLNTQDNPEPSRELGIHSIPTMVLFKDGREVARISGAMTADKIAGFVKSQVVV
jgi:thioredoxin 2